MKHIIPFIAAMLIAPLAAFQATAEKPNVILIICDDLSDYVEGFGGHPQTQTPNMARLAKSGVRFTQAHCNIPVCGPSRASLFTGIYPHHSGCYGFLPRTPRLTPTKTANSAGRNYRSTEPK